MTRILNANLKKFMGAKYERIPKTFVIWAVVLFALRSSEIKLEIAPTVIWLTTVFVTVGGFVQVLCLQLPQCVLLAIGIEIA